MTRKFTRNYSLSVVAPFSAILTFLIAAAVLAQTSGAGQTTGQANAVLAPAGASASAQAERPLIPSTDGAGPFPLGRSRTKRHGASPLDQNAPVFTLAGIYDSGGLSASALAVGDLNGDGKLDMVVANQCHSCSPGSVGVLLGNGDGTFQPAVDYSSGAWNPWSVAIADVNGDGKPDLVVANFRYGVGVLLGNGDGTFRAPVVYDSGANGGFSVAIRDLNNDGYLDLVVASWCRSDGSCSQGEIDVLLGNGDGTFQAPVAYSSGGAYTYSVAVEDLNGDGHLDLVAANNSSGTVTVLLGNGDGTFQAPVSYSAGGLGPNSAVIADVNGDGRPDILVANTIGCSQCHDGGNGDGTFQSPVTFDSGGLAPYSVAMGDVNGDAQPDLLVANVCLQSCDNGNGEGAVGVLLNNPPGPHISTVTTMLPSSPNPSVFGQGVRFTAQVSSSEGTPVGQVTFFDGSAKIGNGTLVNGTTSISVSSLMVGSHAITGTYLGSTKFSPSTSSPISQVVIVATTTTSLVSSPNPVGINNPVTYTATVTGQYGGAATGTITFQDSSSPIATVALANNQAAYSTSYGSVGVHSITASYSGDANNSGSTSSVLTQYVAGTSKTVVTTSGSPSYVGQPVTFTAKVTSKYGAIPDGELVTFYDGTRTMSSVALAGGTAAYTTSSLSAKKHTIEATYAGDTRFLPSTGKVGQTVAKYQSTTTLTSNPNPSQSGQAVTFTVTVAPSGPYPPTGKVRFWDGTIGIGTARLSGGVAKLSTSTLAVGTHPITAKYLGDADNATSTSSVLYQVVQ